MGETERQEYVREMQMQMQMRERKRQEKKGDRGGREKDKKRLRGGESKIGRETGIRERKRKKR